MEEIRETINQNNSDEQLEAELAAIIGAEPPDDDIEYTEVLEIGAQIAGLTHMSKAAEDNAAAEPAAEAQGAGAPAEAAVDAGEADAEELHAAEQPPEEQPTEEVRTGLPAEHAELGELRERIEQRRRYNERKKRRFRARTYIIMSIALAAILLFILSIAGFFTVDMIEVRGNSQFTREEIVNMGHASPGHNLLFDTNKSSIEEYLRQNPYIREARVSRKLPSTLVITVKEREEKLAFPYDDDYLIMDEDGILLKKTRNEPRVTLIEGAIVNKIKLGEKIGTEDSKLTDKMLKLLKTMSRSDLYFIKIDASGSKTIKAYIYDTLVVKADYDTLMKNMSNGRLHQVIEKLFDDGIKRGTITFTDDGTVSFMPII